MVFGFVHSAGVCAAQNTDQIPTGGIVRHLLHRIVVFGQKPTKDELKDAMDKAKRTLDEAEAEWETAKAAVETAQKNMEKAIEAFAEAVGDEEQKQIIRKGLKRVMQSFEDMHKAASAEMDKQRMLEIAKLQQEQARVMQAFKGMLKATSAEMVKQHMLEIAKLQQEQTKVLAKIKKAKEEQAEVLAEIEKAEQEAIKKIEDYIKAATGTLTSQEILDSLSIGDAVVLYHNDGRDYNVAWKTITTSGESRPLLPENTYRREVQILDSPFKDYLLLSHRDETFLLRKSDKAAFSLGQELDRHDGTRLVGAGAYAYFWGNRSSRKSRLKRFQPGGTVETVLIKYRSSSRYHDGSSYPFAVDSSGNVLLWNTSYNSSSSSTTYELYLSGQRSPVALTIEGEAFPTSSPTNMGSSWTGGYTPYRVFSGIDGKIYLAAHSRTTTKEKTTRHGYTDTSTETLQFYFLNGRDFKKVGKAFVQTKTNTNEYSSGFTPYSVRDLRHLGGKMFGLGLTDSSYSSGGDPSSSSGAKLYNASSETIANISGLPSGWGWKQQRGGQHYGGPDSSPLLQPGKDALYGIAGSGLTGQAIYRLPYDDPSQFVRVFNGSGLLDIYRLSVFQADSGDTLAIAAEVRDDEHSIILLDGSGTEESRTAVGAGEVAGLQRIR